MKRLNRRQKTILMLAAAAVLLVAVTLAGQLLQAQALTADFSQKDRTPGFPYPFGTDWMGRDMFARTLAGLSMSIRLGFVTASVSACLALLLGIAAATLGRRVDAVLSWFIDLLMGIPHILLLILISIACGRGLTGVVVGVALTHWTSLARLMRGEILQLREAPFILAAEKLGHGKAQIALRYMAPHLLPQFLTGLILLFPHAILHEASITFLGFGLPPDWPAIGGILSESMRYLSTGKWWLAFFPGLSLVLVVLFFAVAGENVRRLLSPHSAHE